MRKTPCLVLNDVSIDLTDVPSSNPADKSNTLRYDGIVLVAYIEYRNKRTTYVSVTENEANSIEYVYTVRRVKQAEYKFESPDYFSDGTGRYVLFNRHGVRIVFKQTGKIGKFDLQSCLTNIVAAIALIKVATTFVELLMLYFLPERALYRAAKYKKTEDFSDVRDRMRATSASKRPEVTMAAAPEMNMPVPVSYLKKTGAI